MVVELCIKKSFSKEVTITQSLTDANGKLQYLNILLSKMFCVTLIITCTAEVSCWWKSMVVTLRAVEVLRWTRRTWLCMVCHVSSSLWRFTISWETHEKRCYKMDGVYARITWHREERKIWIICGEKQEANPENKAYKLKINIYIYKWKLQKLKFLPAVYTTWPVSVTHCVCINITKMHGPDFFYIRNSVFLFFICLLFAWLYCSKVCMASRLQTGCTFLWCC